MAAGGNGNIAASFKLLLANPNLVASGAKTFAQVDDDNTGDGKKRKRSPSIG